MKKHLLLLLSLFFVIVYTSCSNSDDDSVIIQGVVTNESTGQPLLDAIVQITSPAEFANEFVRTDSAGRYTFTGLNVTTVTEFELTISLTEFEQLISAVTATPGQDLTANFALIPETTGGGDDGGDDDDDDGGGDVQGPPSGAASIILENVSQTAINIRGTGGAVNSVFTFQVQDSAGRALDLTNPVDVQFNIIQGPGGGEGITPEVVSTNAEGRAITSLFSGDSAGVVRVEAVIERPEVPLTIRSTPILVAINGGFPDPNRFFVVTENVNVEGFGILADGLSYTVSASVGDLNGNPVREGTAVDFRTIHGGIIDGSAVTDANGLASVTLRPDGSSPNTSPNGIGFIEVIGRTVDADNNFITQNLDILFTTREANISVNPGTVNIPSGGSQAFALTVEDLNGYPMAAGTQISVEVADGLEVTGGEITLNNSFVAGPGTTQFNFTVSDIDADNSDTVGTSVIVTVTTPSGAVTTLTITGNRAKRSFNIVE